MRRLRGSSFRSKDKGARNKDWEQSEVRGGTMIMSPLIFTNQS